MSAVCGLSDLAGGVMIGKLLDTMATNCDIESILSTSDTFCAAPEILFTSPVEDITRAILEHGESGVPCVITGFPLVEDDERSPFYKSREGMESVYINRSVSIPGPLLTFSLKKFSSRRCVDQRPQRHR